MEWTFWVTQVYFFHLMLECPRFYAQSGVEHIPRETLSPNKTVLTFIVWLSSLRGLSSLHYHPFTGQVKFLSQTEIQCVSAMTSPCLGWVLAWKTGKFSSSELSAINYHYFISQPLCLFLFFSYFSLVTKLHKAFWDSKLL